MAEAAMTPGRRVVYLRSYGWWRPTLALWPRLILTKTEGFA